MTLPQLFFTHLTVPALIERWIRDDTLIIADEYNYVSLNHSNALLVGDCLSSTIEDIKKRHYSTVVAVGGCTALDVGRACALGRIICVPTILSTSCISVDRSIVRHAMEFVSVKTVIPQATIISVPEICQTPHKWSQSGFGDLFANISASIDVQWERGCISEDLVRQNIPKCFEALEWVTRGFDCYDEICLRKLAVYLHNSSLDVIERGDTKLSAGGEHELYYKMIVQQPQYTPSQPTHGQLVAMGALMVCKIYSQEIDSCLYDQLWLAYQRLGLPISYRELEGVGIEKQHIVAGLESMTDSQTYLGQYFAKQENVSSSDLLRIFE